MLNAQKLEFVSIQWNSKLSLSTIRVDVTLSNGDVVKEEYGILGIEREELREGRIYGVVGYSDNSDHRGIVGIHPVSTTRFAAQVKDIHESWKPIVAKVETCGGLEIHNLRLYGVCSHLELTTRMSTL